MLRAALVDAGGTIWPESWSGWAAAARDRLRESFGLSEEQAVRLFEQLERRDPGVSPTTALTQDTNRLLVEALAAADLRRLDARSVLRVMDTPVASMVRPYAGAEEMLMELKGLGLRVVIVSNAFLRTAEGYLRDFEELGISGVIDHVFSSVDTGVRKPSSEMFSLALRAAGSEPAEAVMIGDSEEKDIIPAKGLGLRAIRVAIEGSPPPASAADDVVTRLVDAASLIRRWVEDDRRR